MLNVAVIGHGMAAQTFHHPLIHACADTQLAVIVSSKESLDIPVKHYRDTATMLLDESIDIVVITSPNDTHFPLAKQCLEAGKHVVLEKPMTITCQEAQELFAIADQTRRLLSVFHNRRLDGDFLTVQKLIKADKLGTIRTLRSQWDRFRPEVRNRWRENAGIGSGIWYDLAPHMLDQALILFGKPQAISAQIRAIRPGSQSADYAHVQLHYPEREVILHTSPYSCMPTPRFVLEGDKGTFIKKHLDPQEAQLKAGLTPNDVPFGIENSEHYGQIYYPDGTTETIPTEQGRFGDYYANVAAAIRGEAPLAVKPEEAIAVMQLLELSQQSATQGKTLRVP